MPLFIDQMGMEVQIENVPQRIISLVPSQTELLLDVGLEDKIIGVTKFCIHPKDKVALISKIGGTKNFDFDKIKSLQPDLIIANKEENYKEGIEYLRTKYPVWVSDIFNLEDALAMVEMMGDINRISERSNLIIGKIQEEFEELSLFIKQYPLRKAAYLIWRKPYMTVGSDTFINAMLQQCGFSNVFEILERYPAIDLIQLKTLNPEYIFLSSEPYPFKEKHFEEIREHCPLAKIMLVDGEMFSWYGSRLQYAPGYFRQLLESISD